MAVNKVIYGDNTLIDLTNDTVSPEKLLLGETAHDKSGAPITGTYQGGGGCPTEDIPLDAANLHNFNVSSQSTWTVDKDGFIMFASYYSSPKSNTSFKSYNFTINHNGVTRGPFTVSSHYIRANQEQIGIYYYGSLLRVYAGDIITCAPSSNFTAVSVVRSILYPI